MVLDFDDVFLEDEAGFEELLHYVICERDEVLSPAGVTDEDGRVFVGL